MLALYDTDYQIKGPVIGGACIRNGREENYVQLFGGKP
jgi:hypothetical protein